MAGFTDWRKSSFSEGGESACVEVAWRKSSFSEGAESDCVEVGFIEARAVVRDSKNSDGPMITLPRSSWHHLLTTVGARP